jgi:hypothetical protein
MSDSRTEDELRQTRHDARLKMAEALAEYANAWENVENGFVTGYVAVFEVSSADSLPYVQWITVASDELGGLVPHQVDGLLRKAMRDLVLDQTSSE